MKRLTGLVVFALCLAFAPVSGLAGEGDAAAPRLTSEIVVALMTRHDDSRRMSVRSGDAVAAACKKSGYACNTNGDCCSGSCEVVVCK